MTNSEDRDLIERFCDDELFLALSCIAELGNSVPVILGHIHQSGSYAFSVKKVETGQKLAKKFQYHNLYTIEIVEELNDGAIISASLKVDNPQSVMSFQG